MIFDFAPEVDSLEKVPEPFRVLYAAGEGGKAKLGDTYKGIADTVLGLNKALSAERKSKPDLSPLSEFGTTPEEIGTKVKAKITELADQLAAKGNINPEKIKQEFAAKHGQEITGLNARNEALKTQLYKILVDGRATAAVAEAKGIPDLVLPFVRNSIKVVEENGEFNVFVVDGAGDRRYNMAGQPMSVKELVVELKADPKYGRLFDSEAPSGGGKPPASGGKLPKPAGRELSSVEKIQQGLAAAKKNR